jgi:predicted transcriptional regulator
MEVVQEAAIRVVNDDLAFRAAVRRGIEQADRGEMLSHEEVKTRMEKFLSR